jgi:hypothetical protein
MAKMKAVQPEMVAILGQIELWTFGMAKKKNQT